jgi:predicted Rossmann fold nucleotide-binding protein DprA/Smf involved in DNA uptake
VDVQRIEQGDGAYPMALLDRLGDASPCCLYTMGDAAILRNRLLGLICSIRCPGGIVIQTYDAVCALRDAGVVVIGGFHSPMERECLDILLLRGTQLAIICPARGLAGLRIGGSARKAISEGRLLVLSPFEKSVRRTTALQAMQRNDLVAALADIVWVPHATPGGKTWATIRRVLARGQTVFSFTDDENFELIHSGAEPFAAHEIADAFNLRIKEQQ